MTRTGTRPVEPLKATAPFFSTEKKFFIEYRGSAVPYASENEGDEMSRVESVIKWRRTREYPTNRTISVRVFVLEDKREGVTQLARERRGVCDLQVHYACWMRRAERAKQRR